MKVVRAVFDTNIYVSAIMYGGTPEKVIRLVKSGCAKVYISPFIQNEIAITLKRKFNLTGGIIESTLREIDRLTEHLSPESSINVIKADPSDNRILEVAESARADYIVSGDKHLLQLKKFGRCKIVLSRDFYRLFEKESG